MANVMLCIYIYCGCIDK